MPLGHLGGAHIFNQEFPRILKRLKHPKPDHQSLWWTVPLAPPSPPPAPPLWPKDPLPAVPSRPPLAPAGPLAAPGPPWAPLAPPLEPPDLVWGAREAWRPPALNLARHLLALLAPPNPPGPPWPWPPGSCLFGRRRQVPARPCGQGRGGN